MTSMQAFAADWVEAWNSHDLPRILSHYAEEVVLVSPIAAERLGLADGTVRGKAALGAYFSLGLAARPGLAFTLCRIYRGIGSMVIEYGTETGQLAAEFMAFDAQGQVERVHAHYVSPLNIQ